VAEDPGFTLGAPVSQEPPLHASLACLAIMPRWGLHLVPDNLSQIVDASQTVNRMYIPGNPFSLETLIQAVQTHHPDLVASQHYNWTQIRRAQARLPPNATALSPPWATRDPEAEAKARAIAMAMTQTVLATCQPPLRSWEKERVGFQLPPRRWFNSGAGNDVWKHTRPQGGKTFRQGHGHPKVSPPGPGGGGGGGGKQSAPMVPLPEFQPKPPRKRRRVMPQAVLALEMMGALRSAPTLAAPSLARVALLRKF
jgi:hypothetical protein